MQLLHDQGDEDNLLVLDEEKGWVELPTCGDAGADSSKPLADDISNASWATCKPKGKGAPAAAAPAKDALAQKNNNEHWVELPDCDREGADTSKPLKGDLSNATRATCKKKGVNEIAKIDPYEKEEPKSTSAVMSK